jgi:hypothetical protein
VIGQSPDGLDRRDRESKSKRKVPPSYAKAQGVRDDVVGVLTSGKPHSRGRLCHTSIEKETFPAEKEA